MPMSVNEIQQAANCANWAVSIESENLVWRLYSKKKFQIALYDQNAHSEHCFRRPNRCRQSSSRLGFDPQHRMLTVIGPQWPGEI